MPDGPHSDQMRGTARENKCAKQNKHPSKGDIGAFIEKIEEARGDGVIRHHNEEV